jgi:transcriptional regulator with XRE-family HTH domain
MSVLMPGLECRRRAAGMTQVTLARRVGLRPETLCRLEKQRQAAGLATVQRLAQALGVSATRLTRTAELRKPRRQQQTERVCTDCGLTKPLDAFTPIRASMTGRYGRCRACRARQARERYQFDPNERAIQKERVRRNRLKRAASLRDRRQMP